VYGGWSNTFQLKEHSVSWTLRANMATGIVVQHDDTPREHAGTFSLDGGPQHAFFHEFVQVVNPLHQRTERQFVRPVWTDAALGTPAFNRSTQFPFL
jgi:hypothetical protein